MAPLSLGQPFAKRTYKLPLRGILVVPFVLQIVMAVGLTGWLSLRNSQKAVNDVAGQLRDETTSRIVQHLNDYLKTLLAQAFNQMSQQLRGIYEEVAASENLDSSPSPRSIDGFFPKDLMTFPPVEELAQLLKLVQTGDIDGIQEEALRIHKLDKKYEDFAFTTFYLVQEFEERKIFKLLQPYFAVSHHERPE